MKATPAAAAVVTQVQAEHVDKAPIRAKAANSSAKPANQETTKFATTSTTTAMDRSMKASQEVATQALPTPTGSAPVKVEHRPVEPVSGAPAQEKSPQPPKRLVATTKMTTAMDKQTKAVVVQGKRNRKAKLVHNLMIVRPTFALVWAKNRSAHAPAKLTQTVRPTSPALEEQPVAQKTKSPTVVAVK